MSPSDSLYLILMTIERYDHALSHTSGRCVNFTDVDLGRYGLGIEIIIWIEAVITRLTYLDR